MKPVLVRAGFDTVEYAVSGKIPEKFLHLVAEAKKKAIETRSPYPLRVDGVATLVQPGGGQGGFTYLLSTGPYGATIKFREIGSRDPFCAHVKLSAYGLATKGVKSLKAECDDFFRKINSVTNNENTRISRLDYAMDFYAPSLRIDADEFVTHAKRSKSENIERRRTGDRVDYVRIGSMPNLQLCVYDKHAQTRNKSDLVWQEIFSTALGRACPSASGNSWWRVEFRLGKEAIDQVAAPRLWGKVLAEGARAFQGASQRISWRLKMTDSNRSRWPLHPIWKIVELHLVEQFEHFSPIEISPQTKRQIAENYVAGLEAQCDGLVLTIAAAYEVQADGLENFVERHFRRLGQRLSERADIDDQLAARRERQVLLKGC